MSHNNDQLAHIWAQQTKSEGKNGNGSFHFSGRSLYSYRTEIARFIEGRVVYTRHKYSVTTEGKHKNKIHGAIRHRESYSVESEMRHIPDTWEEVTPIIFLDMLERLKIDIETLLRSRSNIEWKISQLKESLSEARNFKDRYFTDRFFFPEYGILIEDLKTLSTTSEESFLEVLQARFGGQLKEKIQKEKEANKAKKKQIEERNAKEKEFHTDILMRWRGNLQNSNDVTRRYPVMLRYNTSLNLIETSHGAEIPVSDAIKFWQAIKHNLNVIGQRLGEFTINDLTRDLLVVGCHKIPLSEVETIAETLGLKERVTA